MLLDSVTALTKLALANARLQAGILALVRQVESSRRRILQIADTERRELAAELDTGTDSRLERVQLLLEPGETQLNALLLRSRASLADFARGVHPTVLSAAGLAVACAEPARSARFASGLTSRPFVCRPISN